VDTQACVRNMSCDIVVVSVETVEKLCNGYPTQELGRFFYRFMIEKKVGLTDIYHLWDFRAIQVDEHGKVEYVLSSGTEPAYGYGKFVTRAEKFSEDDPSVGCEFHISDVSKDKIVALRHYSEASTMKRYTTIHGEGQVLLHNKMEVAYLGEINIYVFIFNVVMIYCRYNEYLNGEKLSTRSVEERSDEDVQTFTDLHEFLGQEYYTTTNYVRIEIGEEEELNFSKGRKCRSVLNDTAHRALSHMMGQTRCPFTGVVMKDTEDIPPVDIEVFSRFVYSEEGQKLLDGLIADFGTLA